MDDALTLDPHLKRWRGYSEENLKKYECLYSVQEHKALTHPKSPVISPTRRLFGHRGELKKKIVIEIIILWRRSHRGGNDSMALRGPR